MRAHEPWSDNEKPPSIGIARYRELLREFDAAVCEATFSLGRVADFSRNIL
jgi:hypothetical protein